MVVQHNLSAMNTNRQMGVVTDALQKSTEKLSSGRFNEWNSSRG